MKTLSDKQKEYFKFVKEWSNVTFTGDSNNYNDVSKYITRCKDTAHSNFYLSTGGNSAYL